MRTIQISIALLWVASACGPSSPGKNGGDDDGGIVTTPDAALPACTPASAGAFAFEKIATWRDDAKGAYTIIHDDVCDDSVQGIPANAAPALAKFGLNAAMGPIAGACEENGRWGMVGELEQAGHEIISHSTTHVQVTTANEKLEIVDAKASIDAHVMHPVTFYIFPFDYFTDATVAAVGSAGHLGARAGNRDDNDGLKNPPINPATPTNDLQIEFDVWPRNYSKYALFFPEETLMVHVYNAIESGGWAVREFHSVIPDGASTVGQGFGPIELGPYERHLKFLADARKKGILWTAPPTTVLRYRHARTACKASVAGDTIKFDTSNPECVKFATPLSVIVTTTDDLPRVDATQGGMPVSTIKLGPKRYSVTADPTKGAVALSGCSNDGYSTDPGMELPAKPTPAASVCLIETVKGAGGAGKMDDLERPLDEFQALPNPSQADKRTGTWSWYPQNASVAIATDGTNHVLHYSGQNLGKWSGTTLAFLGGNGAGSCYDGSAYQGIRFRIKGNVTSSDTLNGQIVISMVTSETQSRLYGGDLDGEGGHFNKIIPVTSTWQTVTIPWTDLNKPTWGSTTSLPAVAKGKLQAIDWGVSDKASSFDIMIDDVAMY